MKSTDNTKNEEMLHRDLSDDLGESLYVNHCSGDVYFIDLITTPYLRIYCEFEPGKDYVDHDIELYHSFFDQIVREESKELVLCRAAVEDSMKIFAVEAIAYKCALPNRVEERIKGTLHMYGAHLIQLKTSVMDRPILGVLPATPEALECAKKFYEAHKN